MSGLKKKEIILFTVDKDVLNVSQLYALKVRKLVNYSRYLQGLIERDLKNISMMDSDLMKQLGTDVLEFLEKRDD